MPELDDFQESCLKAHNKLREDHQGKPLKWNGELASTAKDWADRLADKGYMLHSDSSRYGENILITEDKEEISGPEVVQKWAEEEKLYDYTHPKWNKGTSRFTQMVWKSTTDVGIAKARLEDGREIVVVHYKPMGNINRPGDYGLNVLSANIPEMNGEGSRHSDGDEEV